MTELTYGQKLVGLNFNPSGDNKIILFNQKISEALDILIEDISLEWSEIKEDFRDKAINELVTAQMWGVKTLTWKD